MAMSKKRLALLLGGAALLVGCARVASVPPAHVITSYCGSRVVDESAMRRVAGEIMDGNYFKSGNTVFAAKVKPRNFTTRR